MATQTAALPSIAAQAQTEAMLIVEISCGAYGQHDVLPNTLIKDAFSACC